MKGQVHHAPVVSADRTAPSGLFDEDSLELLLPTCDRLADATLAAPPVSPIWSGAVLSELGHAVTLTALHLDRALSPRVRRTSALLDKWHRSLQIRVDASPLPRHAHIIAALA